MVVGSEAQHVAVVQEELLAYELGTKLTLQDEEFIKCRSFLL